MNNQALKILFLDFDGVLNTPNEAFNCTLNHELVQRMGLFCYQHDIKVVFSTAWRLYKTFDTAEKLRELLIDFGFPTEVDCIATTPDLSYMMPKGYNNYGEHNLFPLRGYEIRAWLAKNPEVDAYVIVDDIGEQFFEDQYLVHTHDLIGVTKKNLEQINKLFQQQLKKKEKNSSLLDDFKYWMEEGKKDKVEKIDKNKDNKEKEHKEIHLDTILPHYHHQLHKNNQNNQGISRGMNEIIRMNAFDKMLEKHEMMSLKLEKQWAKHFTPPKNSSNMLPDTQSKNDLNLDKIE